jgi:hypothetical protein
VGQQCFERLTLPVLLFLMNNKFYFLFLKTLLSLFINCKLALSWGTGFPVTFSGGRSRSAPRKRLLYSSPPSASTRVLTLDRAQHSNQASIPEANEAALVAGNLRPGNSRVHFIHVALSQGVKPCLVSSSLWSPLSGCATQHGRPQASAGLAKD